MKTRIELALEALNSLVLPTRYLKSTSSAPGLSYWSWTVFVLLDDTLVVCAAGDFPSLSTSPAAVGVSV